MSTFLTFLSRKRVSPLILDTGWRRTPIALFSTVSFPRPNLWVFTLVFTLVPLSGFPSWAAASPLAALSHCGMPTTTIQLALLISVPLVVGPNLLSSSTTEMQLSAVWESTRTGTRKILQIRPRSPLISCILIQIFSSSFHLHFYNHASSTGLLSLCRGKS